MVTLPNDPFASPSGERIAFLVDVDNTLLDNDAAKDEIERRMVALLGRVETARFWETYEHVRRDTGRVAIPQVLIRHELEREPAQDRDADRLRRFALADILFGLPYRTFVYPGAVDALGRLKEIGRVAILTEGEPAYQATKVSRSGLADPADGYVIVCPNKVAYLPEVAAIFPADRIVLVEDKPNNITAARDVVTRLGIAFSGIFVRQGRYAESAVAGDWDGAELTVESIGALAAMTSAQILQALTATARAAT